MKSLARWTCAALLLAGASGEFATAGPVAVGEAPRPLPTYLGALVTPPLAKPAFTLTDTGGAPFDFRAQTQGLVTLLFFGYTHCPDECPLHVVNVALGLKSLPPAVRDQVELVFVTTDPARDDPRTLRAWLDHFDRRFVGLTGSEAAVAAAQRAAGLPPAWRVARAGASDGVGHANVVLAYSKDNLAHLMYPGGVTRLDWAHDLALLVDERWSSR
jgi:protein SCO1